MANRFSININTVENQNRGYLKSLIANTTMTHFYFLHDDPELIDLCLKHNKKVILRIYDALSDRGREGKSFDAFVHYFRPAQDLVDWANNVLYRYKGEEVYINISMNEPNSHDNDEVLGWILEFGHLMVFNGFKVSLGDFNTSKTIKTDGNGDAYEVRDGMWDDLINFCDKYYDSVILSFHDYTVGFTYAQQLPDFPNNLMTNGGIQGKPRDLIWDSYNVNGQWHIGRHAPVIHRARELGKRIRVGIGECWHDNMSDISHVVERLRSSFGIDKYMRDMRGFLSVYNLKKFHSLVYNYDDNEFIKDIVKDWMYPEEQYPDEFEYFAPFAYNSNYEWIAYDYSNPIGIQILEAVRFYLGRKTSVEQNTVEIKGGQYLAKSSNFYKRNVRKEPSVTGAVTSQIYNEVLIYVDPQELVFEDDWYWLRFQYSEQSESFFVAVIYHDEVVADTVIDEDTSMSINLEYVVVIDQEPEPPIDNSLPEVFLDFYGYTQVMTKDELRALKTFFQKLQAAIDYSIGD